MKKYIHVNQHNIKRNAKQGTKDPVITCKTYKSNQYSNRVDILDSSGVLVASVVYNPDKPLPCGARVWIETSNEVKIH